MDPRAAVTGRVATASRVATTGRAAFSGRTIPNLLALGDTFALYRADTGISLNAGNVSGWTDGSGNGRTISQVTAGKQPLFVANSSKGQPGVLCDGVDDFLVSGALTIPQPYTVLMAARITAQSAASSHDVVWTQNTGSTNGLLLVDTTPRSLLNGGASITYAGILCNGAFAVVLCTLNGASGEIRENGVVRASGNVGSVSGDIVSIGALSDGSHSATIEVAEYAIISRALSADDKARAEAYLMARYVP